jgi:hypothetical protein
MKSTRRSTTIALGVSLLALATFSVPAHPQPPTAEAPVLLTSCGQSPGPVMLKVILQKIGVPFELNPLATAADLGAGKPYRSVIVVMGASLKGMGAAGISIDEEVARCGALIEAARKSGLKVIGAHIEGMKRRSQGASAGDTTDERSIDAVAPASDILLVNRDGDSDGRFTAISAAKGIPMITVAKNLDLVEELRKLFGK